MRKVLLLLVLGSIVPLAAAHGPAKAKAATPLCPVCHMGLSKMKTKDRPTAIRLKKGGPVMYCCGGCKMPPSVLVKPKHS